MKFTKGDILIGQGFGKDHSKAFHPIIYIEGDTNDDFIGLMLTTSPTEKWKNNFPLKEEHFRKIDSDGNPFKVIFNKSHCVHMHLNKRAEWAPFEKKGQVTEEALEFIESNLISSSPIYWDDYIASLLR